MRSQRHMLEVQGVDSAYNFYTNAKHNGVTSKVVGGVPVGEAAIEFWGVAGSGGLKYIDLDVDGTVYTFTVTPAKDFDTPASLASALATAISGHATVGPLVNVSAKGSAVHISRNSTTNGNYVAVADIRDTP